MATEPTKTRKPRTVKPRIAYVMMQVLDDDGQPMSITADRVKIVGITKDPAEILTRVTAGEQMVYTQIDLSPKKKKEG